MSANTHYKQGEGKNDTALELICPPIPPPPPSHTHTTHIDLCGGHSCLGLHSVAEGVHLGLKLLLQLIQVFRTQQDISLEGRREGGREKWREERREEKCMQKKVGSKRICYQSVIYASHI